MRRIVLLTAVSVFLLASSLGNAAPPTRPANGSVVIIFRDGHRQAFSLSEIDRIEFAGTTVASSGETGPPRGRFVGKWEVGDGAGNDFTITLNESGDAYRSLGDVHGHWSYVNGEAQVTWDDGAQDAIRRSGTHFQKFAYRAGKSFTDTPDNVTPAKNLTPRPI